jgi:hypothetical protein
MGLPYGPYHCLTFFFGGVVLETQSRTLARQPLYQLSHSASPFVLVVFEIGSLYPGWPDIWT